MFAVGSTVKVVNVPSESGVTGKIIAHNPPNGDYVQVLVEEGNRFLDAGATITYLYRHLEEVAPAPKPVPARYVTRVGENWKDRGHYNTRKTGKVTAVRVAKGDPSGRGGQFHGATNYRQVSL